MLRTGKNISHRKCNKFVGFPYSHKQTLQANKPDLTIKDHKEKTCDLIYFTFPIDIPIDINIFM